MFKENTNEKKVDLDEFEAIFYHSYLKQYGHLYKSGVECLDWASSPWHCDKL